MWWANWMSLGIIVTHFAWMTQRFASSMRLIIYASTASCRHMIVHPWRCISYLPTCLAILWSSCEKGSFQMRSSVLFWNCHIMQRATVPGQYFLGFFTFPACKNSFWGALPPTVGWSILQAGSSPPNLDGLASTAIWTNCWVGNDDGDHPTPSNYSASSTHFSISSTLGGASLAGMGGELEGAFFLFQLVSFSWLLIIALSSHHPSLSFQCQFCSCHAGI